MQGKNSLSESIVEMGNDIKRSVLSSKIISNHYTAIDSFAIYKMSEYSGVTKCMVSSQSVRNIIGLNQFNCMFGKIRLKILKCNYFEDCIHGSSLTTSKTGHDCRLTTSSNLLPRT